MAASLIAWVCLLTAIIVNVDVYTVKTEFEVFLQTKLDSSETIQVENYPIHYLGSEIFERFENLTNLTLKNCSIEQIADDFFLSFTKLTYLNLDHNTLEKIPTTGLEELRVLHIRDNNITKIDFLSELKQLNVLVLDENPLSAISKENFRENKQLQKLHCSHCEYLQAIEEKSFSHLDQLVELIFYKTKVQSTKGIFMGLENLVTLHLTDNMQSPIDGKDFEYLAKLENLNLQGNSLKSQDLGSLPQSVRKLDLSGNDIRNLSGYMFNNFTNLVELYLQNQKAKPVTITEPFFTNTQLKVINLADNGLSDFSTSLLQVLKDHDMNVSLDRNNFNCSCYNTYVRDWFKNNRVNFRYPCGSPQRLNGVNLVHLSMRSLGCIAPFFTTNSKQRVHLNDQDEEAIIRCEAKSFYERPKMSYEIDDGNPLGIRNSTVIVRHIAWERMETNQLRYYAALSFTTDRPLANQTGAILCSAVNAWGNSSQLITPVYYRTELLLPVWAIATITCVCVLVVMIIVLIVLCIRHRKSDSVDMIGTVNGHVRNLVV